MASCHRHLTHRVLAFNAAVAAFLAMVSCSGHSGVERSLDRFANGVSYSLDGAVSEIRAVDLPVDGVVDVDVQTFAGDVVIRAGHGTPGVAEVRATVRATHGHTRSEAAEAALPHVTLTADIRRGGDVPVLEVRAATTDAEPWLERTDIEIVLPEMRRATVRTRAGKVHLFECRGGATVHTSDGEIRYITPWTITEDVTFVTRGADIIYRVNLGSCGLFDVDIVNGRVLARMESGDWRILDKRNDHDTLYAQLGTGTNRILMRTTDARVLVSVVKNPLEYGTLFIEP